jgi:hypothetical protein
MTTFSAAYTVLPQEVHFSDGAPPHLGFAPEELEEEGVDEEPEAEELECSELEL